MVKVHILDKDGRFIFVDVAPIYRPLSVASLLATPHARKPHIALVFVDDSLEYVHHDGKVTSRATVEAEAAAMVKDLRQLVNEFTLTMARKPEQAEELGEEREHVQHKIKELENDPWEAVRYEIGF